jgi:uncharacterized protein
VRKQDARRESEIRKSSRTRHERGIRKSYRSRHERGIRKSYRAAPVRKRDACRECGVRRSGALAIQTGRAVQGVHAGRSVLGMHAGTRRGEFASVIPEEQPFQEPTRSPVWGWRDVAIFFGLSLPVIVLVQVVFALAAQLLHHSLKDPVLGIAAQAVSYPLIFMLLAGLLRVQYNAPFWRSLGWVDSRVPVLASLSSGILIAFGLAVLGGLLHIPDVDSPINHLLESRESAVVLVIFGILIAPLAEELAFRGFLQPLLVRSVGVSGGIGITALLFGMLHWEQNSRSWAYVGIITLAGAAFGVLRHFSGSTRTSILAHVAYNSTLFLAYFAYGRKSSI